MFRRSLWLALCFALLLATTSLALADGEITVTQDRVTTRFQEHITFSLEAQGSTSDIVKVTLYNRVGNQPALNYAYPRFEPGRSIKAEYVWDARKSYLPPGVTLTYYYLLEDAEGHQLKTEPKTFVYTDDRHQWRSRIAGKLSLNWYQGTDAFGQELFAAAQTGLAQLERDAGVTVQQPISIWIYHSYEELRQSIEPGAKEWTGGVSYSELGVILIGVPENRLAWGKRAVAHELSHVVIYQATYNPFGDIPRWLNEGLAMYAEGPLEQEYSSALQRAAAQGKLISLKSLASNFPADPAQATLSYAQSYSVVKYLIDAYGRDKMAALLATFKEGSTYDGALRKVYGLNTEELDAAWQASLGVKPAATPTPTPRTRVTPTPRPGRQPTPIMPAMPIDLRSVATVAALVGLSAGCLVIAIILLVLVTYLFTRQKR